MKGLGWKRARGLEAVGYEVRRTWGGFMRKFKEYPIIINYNLHAQLREESKETELHKEKRYEDERALDVKVNTTSDSTIKDTDYTPELKQYEEAIYQCLRKVDANPVGQVVLEALNKKTTVWIIPKSDKALKQSYSAQTWPLNYVIQKNGDVGRGEGAGDTVIQFQPDLKDDTLFHELVHAYRYSWKRYKPLPISVSDKVYSNGNRNIYRYADYNSEEFLAHQMQDIYLSQSNRPLLKDYHWDEVSDKKTIYNFLLENFDLMGALKFFMHHETLALLGAHRFATDYNPFRDFRLLEAQWLKRKDALRVLPELGTI